MLYSSYQYENARWRVPLAHCNHIMHRKAREAGGQKHAFC